MDGELLVNILYTVILYVALGTIVIPVQFLLLWKFLGFWKKHVALFYVMLVFLYTLVLAAFYLFNRLWIYWFFPFPIQLQIFGLLIFLLGGFVVRLAQSTITLPVRLFYPLLKGEKIHLRTDGFYRYLRHPMYAVFPWMILGVLFYTGQLILLPIVLLLFVTRKWYAVQEENYLLHHVVGDYKKYMKETPNRFYPTIFKP